ncbi:NADPH-dependent F420 reductase [soil metagenome]
MKAGILGTGMVGEALASKLVELGHDVMMGSRLAGNSKAAAWVDKVRGKGRQGTFAEAAAHGEIVINATAGDVSLEALKLAGAKNLDGKILIDVANPLDFSKGMPPTLSISNHDSLGEAIQRAFPDVKVVKTFNTMACAVMVNPGLVPGDHDIFVSGNDDDAKAEVIGLLNSFGWKQPIDLGGISTARGTEQLLPIWLRLWGKLGTPQFNFKIVK